MNNLFRTTDLDFAAVLYNEGKKLHNVEGTSARKVFIFLDDGTIDQLRLKYINKELLVEPQGLWNSTKRLKVLLYREI